MMRLLARFCALLLILVTLSLLVYTAPWRPQVTTRIPATNEDTTGIGFRITLGIGDEEPAEWSGSISLSSGRLARLEGWQLAGPDKVEGNSWQAFSTKPVVNRTANASTPVLVDPSGILPVGVEGVIIAPDSARVSITSRQGNFNFELKELAYGKPLQFLKGAARVECQPVTERLTDAEFEDDHPSVAVRRDGSIWVAWIGYRDRHDEIFVRCRRDGTWSETMRVSAQAGDFFRTALAEDAQGRLWVIWSQQTDGNWDLHGRSLEDEKWSPVVRLSDNRGPDIFHTLGAGKDGKLALAWMSFREGQSDIYLKTWDGSRWSEEVKISESGANDWEPAVAIDSRGKTWVAWDSYERGSYNILLRSVEDSRAGNLIRVTDSPRYHARASVAVDSQDRVWVAWEESEANWGKDYGYWARSTPWQQAGNPLYRSRSAQVAVVENATVKTPSHELMDSVPASLRQYVQMPQLVSDPAGRMWAFLRIRSFVRTETADVWASGGRWDVYLTVYSKGEWLPVIPFPDSVAANYARIGAAIAPDGKIWCAWPADGRLFSNPPKATPGAPNLTPRGLQGFAAVPQNYEVYAAALKPPALTASSSGSKAELSVRRPDLASAVPVHPREEEDLKRIRGYEIRSGGKIYRIYRGDMHRHTDISADGAGDGSVMDLFRYALDAARMDYAMVTDHNSGYDQEYSWWRIEKTDDLFQMQGHFTTLFGYERSLNYPNGHRNLAFAQRGVRTLPVAEGEQAQQEKVKVNSGSVLYPYLRQNRGIAFSHTSHTNMGTDWRDNDPELEPLVEIYQGMRTSAEYEGAPKAPTKDKPATHQGGFKPEGFVWNAWAKGYKLGVQASSDHISTHISYSCIISEEFSREGLINAMRRRHAYAASDNIIVDVRMLDGTAEYIQGDDFIATGQTRLLVKVIGTAAVEDIQVIKNNRFVYSQRPNLRAAEFTFTDTEMQPGQSYYYVRAIQTDGQLAWSSPIWVTHK